MCPNIVIIRSKSSLPGAVLYGLSILASVHLSKGNSLFVWYGYLVRDPLASRVLFYFLRMNLSTRASARVPKENAAIADAAMV